MTGDSQKVPGQTAIRYALGKLSRRFYSRRAMRDMLSESGYGGESVEDALSKLEEWGYLDDLRLAGDRLRRYTARQPKGKLWIRRKLVQEGFEPDAIRQVLETYTDERERELAAEAAERFLQSKARTLSDPEKSKLALARFLTARGFSPALIHQILPIEIAKIHI
jgi:regulatory protein